LSLLRRFGVIGRAMRGLGRDRLGLGLFLLVVAAQLLQPMGAYSMGGGAVPGDDICYGAPRSGSPSDRPANSHDKSCCAFHCLGTYGGALPARAPALAIAAQGAESAAWVPAAAWHPESRPSPFSARAPPLRS
jgi:hypothetical protein